MTHLRDRLARVWRVAQPCRDAGQQRLPGRRTDGIDHLPRQQLVRSEGVLVEVQVLCGHRDCENGCGQVVHVFASVVQRFDHGADPEITAPLPLARFPARLLLPRLVRFIWSDHCATMGRWSIGMLALWFGTWTAR
ncbi:hypothetical protein ACPPVO_36040 [Dactylosporangium sp. McL0621]|uniref:hypothetical protein n=1 Tax=Dactylosporangium sp. McL0621 TaxID=3415678 RepID=UPI003CEA9E09